MDGLRQLKSGAAAEAANFREWMDAIFGGGIVKYFMEPYNRKVWGVPLETMGKEWIAERVSVVDLARIERNIAEQRDDVSWGPNNSFKFPRKGGTGAIFEGIARPLRDRITLHQGDGERRPGPEGGDLRRRGEGRYDVLINTSPLDGSSGHAPRSPTRSVMRPTTWSTTAV